MIRCGTAQAEGNQNGGGGILGATMGRAGGYKNAKALYILPCPRKGRCCFTCSMQADRAAGSAGASTAHVWKTKGCTVRDSARPLRALYCLAPFTSISRRRHPRPPCVQSEPSPVPCVAWCNRPWAAITDLRADSRRVAPLSSHRRRFHTCRRAAIATGLGKRV